MSSGPSVGIANGIAEAQIDFNQFSSEITAKENEDRVAQEIETDFFVGPNGKALPKKLKKWIGSSRRNSL